MILLKMPVKIVFPSERLGAPGLWAEDHALFKVGGVMLPHVILKPHFHCTKWTQDRLEMCPETLPRYELARDCPHMKEGLENEPSAARSLVHFLASSPSAVVVSISQTHVVFYTRKI